MIYGDLVENHGLLRLHQNRSESIFSDECTGRSVRAFFTNLWEKTRYINLGQVLKKILLILLEILTKVSKFPSALSSRLFGPGIFPDRHFVRKIFLFRFFRTVLGVRMQQFTRFSCYIFSLGTYQMCGDLQIGPQNRFLKRGPLD